jgi:hypothetical protein
VSAGIKLIARTTASSGQTHCALCGEPFELLHNVATLVVDDTPRGYVCQGCVIDGPARVAVKIRARAGQLHDLAKRLRAAFTNGMWAALIQATNERASYWDALAERVEKLENWTVEQS